MQTLDVPTPSERKAIALRCQISGVRQSAERRDCRRQRRRDRLPPESSARRAMRRHGPSKSWTVEFGTLDSRGQYRGCRIVRSRPDASSIPAVGIRASGSLQAGSPDTGAHQVRPSTRRHSRAAIFLTSTKILRWSAFVAWSGSSWRMIGRHGLQPGSPISGFHMRRASKTSQVRHLSQCTACCDPLATGRASESPHLG